MDKMYTREQMADPDQEMNRNLNEHTFPQVSRKTRSDGIAEVILIGMGVITLATLLGIVFISGFAALGKLFQ